ncbi:hypothetical protein [Streptomyces sp. AB3(2024)]|uniref:hypothetical protein n=1 Tax=Streptomyces sp. AB3(2024) TaxID=3317321 RepID=UPI0035A29AAB
MTEPLPRRTTPMRQAQDQPGEGLPGTAFVAPADVGAYGQPSLALIARANRGWRNLDALHGGSAPGLPRNRLGMDLLDGSSTRPPSVFEPSADLYKQARAGWERFLGTASEVCGG